MIEIFLSVRHPKIYIERYSEEVGRKEAELSNHFFISKFEEKSDITAIVFIDPKATLINKDFLTVAAKNVNDNSHMFISQYIVGLSGIHKLYYKFYINLLSKQTFKRELVEDIVVLERRYNFNFKDDFICHLKT